MAFILSFYSSLDFMTKAVLGTMATILFLIVLELLEVNNDQKDVKNVLSPIIMGLIITFISIVINRLAEILK